MEARNLSETKLRGRLLALKYYVKQGSSFQVEVDVECFGDVVEFGEVLVDVYEKEEESLMVLQVIEVLRLVYGINEMFVFWCCDVVIIYVFCVVKFDEGVGGDVVEFGEVLVDVYEEEEESLMVLQVIEVLRLVPSCCVIFDLEPFLFDFDFNSEIFKSFPLNLDDLMDAKIGTKVNINEIAFETSLDLVTSMLWGCSKAGEGDNSVFTGGGFREVEYKIFKLLEVPNISDNLPVLSCLDLQGRQHEMQRQLEYIDRNFNNIIKERIKVNSRNIERGNMVTAATDASSKIVEWVMANIMHNLSVKKKVQDELTKVIGKNVVEESHLPKLSYLDAVIKETFRLHPPLPLLIYRSRDETCKVGGYTIPKGYCWIPL
nr:cytochrome P450 76C1-like [Tanacetum cinerariifolium]